MALPDDVDDSFVLNDDDTITTVLAAYRAAWEAADEIAAAHSLDDLADVGQDPAQAGAEIARAMLVINRKCFFRLAS